MSVERGAANINWGKLNKDAPNGPTGHGNGGSKGTPSLDSIMSGKKSPVPNSGTITGTQVKKGVGRRLRKGL